MQVKIINHELTFGNNKQLHLHVVVVLKSKLCQYVPTSQCHIITFIQKIANRYLRIDGIEIGYLYIMADIRISTDMKWNSIIA